MGCVKQTDSKYLSRPSPPYHANDCKDKVLKGNDNKLYLSKRMNNNSYRWVLQKNSERSGKSNKRNSKRVLKRSGKKSSKRNSKRNSNKRVVKRSSKRSSNKRVVKRSGKKSKVVKRRSVENNGKLKKITSRKIAPMLAKNYDTKIDPSGWWHSEKLDGVRSIWNGKEFISRNQKVFNVPNWYKDYFPKGETLDGEFFTKRDNFDGTISIVSHKTPNEKEWEKIKYKAFDIPTSKDKFEERMTKLKSVIKRSCGRSKKCPISFVKQTKIKDRKHLQTLHKSITKQKGEGSMIRKSRSLYEHKRSSSLLKYKDFEDDDAIVVDQELGKGKYSNVLGQLVVKWKKGNVQFKVGSGFTDEDRKNYKKKFPIGKVIRVQYNGKTSSGKPRFPVYTGIHIDR